MPYVGKAHGDGPDSFVVESGGTLDVQEGSTLKLGGLGTVAAVAGAAILNNRRGTVTSEALTTGAGTAYTLTLTNSVVSATSVVLVSVDNGTNTQGELTLQRVSPSAGQVVIAVKNTHGTLAYNGTIKLNFIVL